MEFRMTFKSR